MAFLVRAAFLLVLLRLLVRFGAAVVRGYRGEDARRGTRSPRASELVRDRMCNTFVPRERALVASIAGREERFCSAACRDKALHEARRAS
ncbi:MAG TPA: hypothetical protein VKA01_14360 [Vicinamibacteria bacterium]|nr:hypothetical protein [Vicinamibacteria bacterium]